jgi:hypothetical protein
MGEKIERVKFIFADSAPTDALRQARVALENIFGGTAPGELCGNWELQKTKRLDLVTDGPGHVRIIFHLSAGGSDKAHIAKFVDTLLGIGVDVSSSMPDVALDVEVDGPLLRIETT